MIRTLVRQGFCGTDQAGPSKSSVVLAVRLYRIAAARQGHFMTFYNIA